MKDYIEIKKSDGSTEKMEIVTTFELENRPEKYIIYRTLDASHYYLAKYKDDTNELDTNISTEEYNLCQKIFDEVIR